MKATDVIKLALDQSKGLFLNLVTDMKDDPTRMPTPKGGNHPLWVIGHLTSSESSMVHRLILGEENPLEHWKPLFGGGSEPVADASKYPAWDEVLAEFDRVRAKTLQVLAKFTDADLDGPSKAPDNMKAWFGTIGQCFSMLSVHVSVHAGQVADARRAAGRKPVFG